MTDFLNLPNVRTIAVDEEDGHYAIHAKAVEPQPGVCGLFCPVKRNGTKVRKINDVPHHGKAAIIYYSGQRFTCSECQNGGLYERLPFLHEGFWMTRRLATYLAKQSMRRTFAEVARDCALDAKTVAKAFGVYVDRRIDNMKRETPRVIGVDEKDLLGTYRAVLGNLEERTVLNMLPDRKEALERYFQDLPNKERVEIVVTDRYEDYRRIVRDFMPGRLHVTDRFHVTDKASAILDVIRSNIAKSLSDGRQKARLRMAKNLFRSRWIDLSEQSKAQLQDWGRQIPTLSDAYWAKEHYCDMYLCGTPDEAERYYKAWLRDLPDTVAHRFRKACAIPPRWLPMVFAYFEAPYTTGYVESINRFLDDLQRDGRGYSFDVMRAKLLLTEKLENRTFRGNRAIAFNRGGPLNDEGATNLGASVDLLIRAFQDGGTFTYRGVTTQLPSGLSTLEPVFEDAA